MHGFIEKLLRPLLIDDIKQIIKHTIIKVNIKLEHELDLRLLDILTKYYDIDLDVRLLISRHMISITIQFLFL